MSLLRPDAHRKICYGSKGWSLVTFCPWGLCEEENHAKSFLALASVALWKQGSGGENPGKERRAEAAKPGVGARGGRDDAR